MEGDENMSELLFVAVDKYQVKLLQDLYIYSFLSKALDEENTVRLLVLIHLHSTFWLQADCIDLIVNNHAVFYQLQEFLNLIHNYPNLYFEIP